MTLYIPSFSELTLAETYRMTGWTASYGCLVYPYPYFPPIGWGCDPSFTEVSGPNGAHGVCGNCRPTQVRVIANYQTEVTFITDPTGAQIFIDGAEYWGGALTAVDGATFRGISPALHTYELRKSGLTSATGSFTPIVGTPITISRTLTFGSASFTSSPSGARIWIDDIDQGVNTPNTISGITTGSHNYTLKLTGYQDTSGSFSVTTESTTTVPLVTFLASAYFTSTPTGATIWIDDVNLSTVTPATIVGLTSGNHTYRLIKIGYTNRGSFSTTDGTTTDVSQTLTAVGLNGSIWVEDQYLCYINANNVATYTTGTSSGSVAGLAGSIWVEGTQLAYIDAFNNKRLLPVTTLGSVAGLNGSMWIDGNYLYYIVSGIQRYVTI